MQERLKRLNDPKSGYFQERSKLDKNDKLHENLVRSVVENAFIVRVPFFGVAFDRNDLGLLGGIGLICILVLLRLSLRSQIVSLRIGFKAALRSEQTEDFYDLVAARQVFVFPILKDEGQDLDCAKGGVEKLWERIKTSAFRTKHRKTFWTANRNVALRVVPQIVSLFPAAVYCLIVLQDYWSRNVGYLVSESRTRWLMRTNVVCFVLLLALALWCISKWNEVYRLWDYYENEVEKKRNASDLVAQVEVDD